MKVKICQGPSHNGIPVELPLTEEHWYFNKSGPYAGKLNQLICRKCVAIRNKGRTRSRNKKVDYEKVKPFLEELILRCGSKRAAARYIGISDSALFHIMSEYRSGMQKRTAVAIITGLARKRGEDRTAKRVHERYVERRSQIARIERKM